MAAGFSFISADCHVNQFFTDTNIVTAKIRPVSIPVATDNKLLVPVINLVFSKSASLAYDIKKLEEAIYKA